MRKQLSLYLPFIEFKTTNEVSILRVLGKMLRFRTAMHPCCRLHPCPAAKRGSVTGSDVPAAEGRNLMFLLLAALSEHLEEMVSAHACAG